MEDRANVLNDDSIVTPEDGKQLSEDSHAIAVDDLSKDGKINLEIIRNLQEPCDRATYGRKLREAADRLRKSVRSVQRLVKKWEAEGLKRDRVHSTH
jgi:putative transposase